MCLAIPGRIIEIDNKTNMARIDVMGAERDASVDLVPDAKVGDYILTHAGFAITIIDEAEAAETIGLIEELAQLAGPEARIAG